MLSSFSSLLIDFGTLPCHMSLNAFQKNPKAKQLVTINVKQLIDSVPDEDLKIILLITFLKGKETITLTLIS